MVWNMGRCFKKITGWIAAAAFLAAAFCIGRQAAVMVNALATDQSQVQGADSESKMRKFCVVIDAGHGGEDPGKVGVNGTLEKELNLAVAKQLKTFLEQADVEVVMTRTNDQGLYDQNASGKKAQDMKRRVVVMEEVKPDLAVSIHQNSYSNPQIAGAQVFYYTNSADGKLLAQKIQQRLVQGLDPDNHRREKDNDSYYLLKKTKTAIVIVECGFLSNPGEEELLADPVYQEKVAWQIHLGILQYLNGR